MGRRGLLRLHGLADSRRGDDVLMVATAPLRRLRVPDVSHPAPVLVPPSAIAQAGEPLAAALNLNGHRLVFHSPPRSRVHAATDV